MFILAFDMIPADWIGEGLPVLYVAGVYRDTLGTYLGKRPVLLTADEVEALMRRPNFYRVIEIRTAADLPDGLSPSDVKNWQRLKLNEEQLTLL